MSDPDDFQTFASLYDTLLLSEEVIITIPLHEVERTKVGLKNHKSRLNSKMAAEGLAMDQNILVFSAEPSENFVDYVNLRITLKKPAGVAIKQIIIPKGLPE